MSTITIFYGASRPGADVPRGTLDQFWLRSMQAGLKNAYDSIKATHQNQVNADPLASIGG